MNNQLFELLSDKEYAKFKSNLAMIDSSICLSCGKIYFIPYYSELNYDQFEYCSYQCNEKEIFITKMETKKKEYKAFSKKELESTLNKIKGLNIKNG